MKPVRNNKSRDKEEVDTGIVCIADYIQNYRPFLPKTALDRTQELVQQNNTLKTCKETKKLFDILILSIWIVDDPDYKC